MMETEMSGRHETVAVRKDALVKDLKSVVGDVDKLAKEMAYSTSEGFIAARTQVEEGFDKAKSRLDSTRHAIVEKAKVVSNATNEYVKENPWKVFGVAAVAGLAIGLFMRRR